MTDMRKCRIINMIMIIRQVGDAIGVVKAAAAMVVQVEGLE